MNYAELTKSLSRMFEPVWRCMRLIVNQLLLESVDDSTGIQTIKASILADEILEIPRYQNYGFTSSPLPGSAEGIAVFVGANRDNGVAVVVDDRTFRIKDLGAGQVAMYDSLGNKILLKNSGEIDVEAAGKVNILAPLVDIGSGAKEPVLNGQTFQTGYNAHIHTCIGISTTPPVVPSPTTDLSTAVQAAKLPV